MEVLSEGATENVLHLVSSRKFHTTRRRGHLRVVISSVLDLSGSGRGDMLMRPVVTARAAVATGALVKPKDDIYLIRASVFYPSAGVEKKKKIRRELHIVLCKAVFSCIEIAFHFYLSRLLRQVWNFRLTLT